MECIKYVHPLVREMIDNVEFLSVSACEKEDKSNIPVNESLYKMNLQKNEVFGWMEGCDFKLVTKENVDHEDCVHFESLDKLFTLLENEAKTIDVKGVERSVIALDLETTSLSTSYKSYGGKIHKDVSIVGVCLATSENEGYYIPIMHTEEDGIKNWEYEDCVDFLNKINERFHLIYHNAQYDMAVQLLNGVIVETKNISDTLLVNKLMANNNEFFPKNIGNGLKNLSEYVLGRKMLEINELLGVPKKSHISFNRLPALNAYSYAVSDACNTFGLFKSFVIEDKYGRSPYKNQLSLTKIVHSSVYHTVSTVSYGLPIDMDALEKATRTSVIRILLIEDKFKEYLNKYELENIKMSSPMIGNFIVKMMKVGWKGNDSNFFKVIDDLFGIKRKTQTLKSGVVKESFDSNDDIIKHIKSNLDKADFIPDDVKNDLLDVLNMISDYRSLSKDSGTFISIMFMAFKDSRNAYFTPIALKLFDTDTGRYASSKGTGPDTYISFKKLKTKVNSYLLHGNGVTPALNSQGMPSTPVNVIKRRKVPKNHPAYKRYQTLIQRADNYIKEKLMIMGVKK